jgi:hypothetical protein
MNLQRDQTGHVSEKTYSAQPESLTAGMEQAWRKRYGIHRDGRDDPNQIERRAPEDREAEEMRRQYALRDDPPQNRWICVKSVSEKPQRKPPFRLVLFPLSYTYKLGTCRSVKTIRSG